MTAKAWVPHIWVESYYHATSCLPIPRYCRPQRTFFRLQILCKTLRRPVAGLYFLKGFLMNFTLADKFANITKSPLLHCKIGMIIMSPVRLRWRKVSRYICISLRKAETTPDTSDRQALMQGLGYSDGRKVGEWRGEEVSKLARKSTTTMAGTRLQLGWTPTKEPIFILSKAAKGSSTAAGTAQPLSKS